MLIRRCIECDRSSVTCYVVERRVNCRRSTGLNRIRCVLRRIENDSVATERHLRVPAVAKQECARHGERSLDRRVVHEVFIAPQKLRAEERRDRLELRALLAVICQAIESRRRDNVITIYEPRARYEIVTGAIQCVVESPRTSRSVEFCAP